MLTLKEVRQNPFVLKFLKESKHTLQTASYTDHGLNHAELVAKRSRLLAENFKLPETEQEMCAIAGFTHDFGNFLGRENHDLAGAMLFQNIFKDNFNPNELTAIMKAISDHDGYELKLSSPISAIVILADKSDTRRERVLEKNITAIKSDIHSRVNYAVTGNRLKIDKKRVTLILKIDTNFVPVMEFFEIFTNRMVYCRKAAECLDCSFALIINGFKLL